VRERSGETSRECESSALDNESRDQTADVKPVKDETRESQK